MNILRTILNLFKIVGKFLDSPEVPTKKSERINDTMLGIAVILILIAVFIGNMLLVTGPAAFPVG